MPEIVRPEGTSKDVPPEFRDAVAELLYQCQSIEWKLRMNLSQINELADQFLRPRGVRFKQRREDFEKLPLGRLVHLYGFHTDGDDLVRRLGALIEHRNMAAHAAFLDGAVCNHAEQQERLSAMTAAVQGHAREAKALSDALGDEFEKLNAALWDEYGRPS